jgi:hypothetical protein
MDIEKIEDQYPDMLKYNTDYFNQSVNTWEAYSNLFEKVRNEKVIGESSSGYINGHFAAQNIAKYIPEVKMLLIIRDPVERLISRWSHIRQDTDHPIGQNPLTDVFENQIWQSRQDLVSMGFYYSNLQKFYKYFDKSQIKVVLFDDLIKSPDGLLREVFQFLSVDSDWLPEKILKHNPSGVSKFKVIDKLIGRKSTTFRFIRSTFPRFYHTMSKSSMVRNLITQIRSKNSEKHKIPESVKSRIYNEFYREEINNLEILLHKDLSHWKHIH